MFPKLEEGAAFAGVSLAAISILQIYKDTAPSLREIRAKPPGDFEGRQLLLDAEMLGLIVVVSVGGAGAVLVRRLYPVILAGVVLLLVSCYYRSVLNSSNVGVEKE